MENNTQRKERKILDYNFDGEHLHFDLRFSFPVENLSGELIKDLYNGFSKEELRNGTFSKHSNGKPVWLTFALEVGEDENGNDTFIFCKKAKDLEN